MKIISPFKDYYDHAVHASQIDPSIVFIRKTNIVNTGPIAIPFIGHMMDRAYKVEHEKSLDNETILLNPQLAMLTVGARAFPLLLQTRGIVSPTLLPTREAGLPHHMRHLGTEPCASGSWDGYVKLTLAHRARSFTMQSPVKSYERYHRAMNPTVEKRIKNENIGLGQNFSAIRAFDATSFCMHHQTPVTLTFRDWPFSQDKPESLGLDPRQPFTMLNPPLSMLNAFEVIDAFQAWQECSMFIGGVMPGRQSPMVEVSNETKIEKAGFDKVYSFRRRPEAQR